MQSSRILRALIVACHALTYCGLAAPTLAFEPFQPLPATPPIPADNRQTPEKIALGHALYFDPRLSFTGVLNCNVCHDVFAGGDDGQRVSVGALGQPGRRNAPTLWNVAFQSVYFQDGRADSLEAAIAVHLRDATVMAMPNEATVVGRLEAVAGYRERFAAAFPRSRGISHGQVAMALASYLRTLVTPNAPFDRYLKGDEDALSVAARRGLREFTDNGCAACHFWVNLSGPAPGLALEMGEGFYELFPNHGGTRYDEIYDLLSDDMGRFHIDGREEHKYLWRVPTLRNIALTAPYFHNGAVAELDEAVRVMAKTQFLHVPDDRQVADIVEFLEHLTGERPEQAWPELP